MGTKINVWYPKGSNVGHASIEILGVYMSWWPDAESKMKMYWEIFGAGGPGQAPTYENDKLMEGGDPSWSGDVYLFDREQQAVDYWKRVYFSDFQKGVSGGGKGNAGAKYQFVTNNCCQVVDQLLVQAGAYDWKVKLNLWRGMKGTLAPKDIATIGCYLAGQTDILSSPKMWSPVPEFWE